MVGILNSYIRNPHNKSTNLAKTVSLLIFGEEKLAFRPMWVIWLWAVFPLKISMIAKLWRLRHQNSNSALAAPSRPVDPSSRVTRLGNLWRMWSSSDRSPIRTIYDFLNKPMIYMTWCQILCTKQLQCVSKILTPRRMLQKTWLIAKINLWNKRF